MHTRTVSYLNPNPYTGRYPATITGRTGKSIFIQVSASSINRLGKVAVDNELRTHVFSTGAVVSHCGKLPK